MFKNTSAGAGKHFAKKQPRHAIFTATAGLAVLAALSLPLGGTAFAAEVADQAPAITEQAAAKLGDVSETVVKSLAEALKATLPAAPEGALWRWVTDTPATTKTVVDEEAYDEQVTVWETSDGEEFATEAEADAYCKAAEVTYKQTVKTVHHDATYKKVLVKDAYDEQVTTWVTSDGKTFATEAEAKAHCDAEATVVTVTGSRDWWATSDGETFESEAEAEQHAADATVHVTYYKKDKTVHHPAVYENVKVKDAYDEQVTHPAEYKTVHHDAVTHVEKQWTGKYYWITDDDTIFYDEQECADYCWEHGNMLYSTNKLWESVTVTDKEAWDEQVLVKDAWTETVHHDAVYEDVKVKDAWVETVTTWCIADGSAEFGTEAEAKAHCDAHTVIVTVDGSGTDWATSDGQWFATKSEAESHAAEASTKPTYAAKVQTVHHDAVYEDVLEKEAWDEQVTVWLCSDGEEFGDEVSAAKHCASKAVAYREAEKTVHHDAVTHEEPVEETGHWLLAAKPAETPESDGAGSTAATAPSADGAASTETSGTAALPSTGDASIVEAVAAALSGATLLGAGITRRRR